jgi:hypothetical protein
LKTPFVIAAVIGFILAIICISRVLRLAALAEEVKGGAFDEALTEYSEGKEAKP